VADKDYSATPLPRKLGIREGSRVLLVAPPPRFEATLGSLPDGAELFRRPPRRPLDVIVLFATAETDLRARLAPLPKALDPAGRLWIAWPKKASRVATDLSFAIVQRLGLDAGLVDNKSASIDAVHQGVQFVYRLRDRPPRA
jgi:hypothetical protein